MAKSNNIEKISGYELTRLWFDFAFENQEKLCPSHTAMFMWFIELNNRMGWAERFSSPASQTMSAIGLKSYNSYKRIFDDLVLFGFVKVISESKNQWTACVIAISNNDKATDKAQYKALDKALIKHTTKQSESTQQSTDSINKPLNKETFKQGNKETEEVEEIPLPQFDFNLSKKIMDFFGFTEIKNFDKLRSVGEFLRCLMAQDRVSDFELQFDAYISFKKINDSFPHSFKNFLGTHQKLFEDGAWNAENWIKKLETEKLKLNGKDIKSNSGRRSNQVITRAGSYSDL